MRSARWNTFNFIALSIKILLFRIVSVSNTSPILPLECTSSGLSHQATEQA